MPGRDPALRHGEKGQAVFLVLVAIALFGALAYVVMQGGKGASTIGEKGDEMTAFARLTAFPEEVRLKAEELLLGGLDAAGLDFSRDAKGRGAVFAQMPYQNPPLSVGAASDWGFKGVTAEGGGFFIAGLGADDAGGKDIFAYLDGLDRAACEQIKKALGLSVSTLTEAVTVNLAGTGGGPDSAAGNNAFTFSAHNEDRGGPLRASCVRNGNKQDRTPNYTYYHVIVAR